MFNPPGSIRNGKRQLDRKFECRCLGLESRTLADIKVPILALTSVSGI
jgi:hypothetical protein